MQTGTECADCIKACDLRAIIQTTTLERVAAKHFEMRGKLQAKTEAEMMKQQREENDDAKKGLKAMSRKVNGPTAAPLLFVKRDEHYNPDQKIGSFTTNPDEIDGVVRRAWQKIYNGNTDDAEKVVNDFMEDIKDIFFRLRNTKWRRSPRSLSLQHSRKEANQVQGWMAGSQRSSH